MVTTLGMNDPNIQTHKKNNFICYSLTLLQIEREEQTYFVKIVVDVEMFTEEESCHEDPINNEQGNIRDGEIWVNLNESRNDNPFELLQTVKDIKEELKRVKEDNERILKAQIELNNVLLTTLHSNEEENNKRLE